MDLTIQRPRPRPGRFRLLVLAPVEALEDRAVGQVRHAGALVLDPRLDLLSLRPRADPDRRTFRRELARVGEQVHEHLRQARASPSTAGSASGRSTWSVCRRWISSASIRPLACVHDIGEIHRLAPEAKLAGLDAHALEEIVDEPRQPHGAPFEGQDEIPASCGSRLSSPSRSSSMDASWAASGVRNSCEMFARIESRARRTPSSSVSSRMTCTCRSSTIAELVITVVRDGPEPGARRSVACAEPAVRAFRIGQSVSQGRTPPSAARLQHVAAERADDGRRGHAEQLGGPRVQVADAALPVDGVDAFHDAVQHRLGLGLAAPERASEVHEAAAHVFHRAGERADLRRTAGGNGGGEVALAEAARG